MIDLERHYSVVEAAKRLGGLSPRTLYNWASQGKIQKVKVGARVMIAESELRRLLTTGARQNAIESRQQKQTTEVNVNERAAVG